MLSSFKIYSKQNYVGKKYSAKHFYSLLWNIFFKPSSISISFLLPKESENLISGLLPGGLDKSFNPSSLHVSSCKMEIIYNTLHNQRDSQTQSWLDDPSRYKIYDSKFESVFEGQLLCTTSLCKAVKLEMSLRVVESERRIWQAGSGNQEKGERCPGFSLCFSL